MSVTLRKGPQQVDYWHDSSELADGKPDKGCMDGVVAIRKSK